MAKSTRGRRRIASRQFRPTPYPLCYRKRRVSENLIQQNCSKAVEKDWKDATCSVCMEYPHNAVLLLCSSHDKGCRPYMCGTSCRYSNCLDQYKKAYTKAQPLSDSVENLERDAASSWSVQKYQVEQLACPLCRGQVKGWTVVEPARAFLNAKKRTCMQEKCSFVGTYKELRRHVRSEHPSARPREVDPVDEQKWRRLERERERDDVISTITSSMPGAMVFGDYVIEGSPYVDTDEEDGFDANVADGGGFEMGIDRNLVNVFLLLHAIGPAGDSGSYGATRRQARDSNRAYDADTVVRHASPLDGFDSSDRDIDSEEDSEDDGNVSGTLFSRLHRQGVLLERSGRRRQNREANGRR